MRVIADALIWMTILGLFFALIFAFPWLVGLFLIAVYLKN